MKKTLQIGLALLAGLALAQSAAASPVAIYSAPRQYQNGGVNPCIFSGNGQNGCNQLTIPFPDFVQSTQQFNTNPLVNTYGDAPGELAQFAAGIGRDFILGLDVNEAGVVQTLSGLTITFRGATNNVLGTGYQLGGTPVSIPFTQQGEGFTDYVVAAGCAVAVGGGSGVAATCSKYTPFTAPVGTRSIEFTYGMGLFNDGAERLFLIADGGGTIGVITPFDVEPSAVPEPTSMVLLGSGLALVARRVRRKTVSRVA